MKIAIGNDHGGVELKNILKEYMEEKGHEVVNYGTDTTESMDYPDIARKLSEDVRDKDFDCGVLICGTGIGMSIAANKVKGIRAAAVDNVYSAKMSKEHNNANILCLGARVLGDELAKMVLDAWLTTEFEGGRHQRRVDKISKIEE